MIKTTGRLSDGREILYYDQEDHHREPHDERDLAAVTTGSEIRLDPVLNEWVAVAGHRQTRTFLPSTQECPLCPTRPGGYRSEIPTADYEVVVFENRFPSFASEVPDVAPTVDAADVPGSELYQRRRGVGRCEVVCFTSEHTSAFSQLAVERVRLVIDVWVDRTAALAEHPEIEQVYCFENRGEAIGVTLHHPHGQIYGYPFVTPRTRQMLTSARRHRDETGRSLFADVLAAEVAAEVRVVVRTEHWTAFVPAAARWPVEVHLYPNRQVPDLPALTDAERDDLATVYHDVLQRCDSLYENPLPYIASWYQAPVRVDRDLAYLHLQLTSIQRAPGKLKYLAGSESGMGVFINDVFPEDVAARLRDAR